MSEDKLFEQTKREVFGEPPRCAKKRTGYNICTFYYSPVLVALEQTLISNKAPSQEIQSFLKFAFRFSEKTHGYDAFPKKTRKAIKSCTRAFRERYQGLLNAPQDFSPS